MVFARSKIGLTIAVLLGAAVACCGKEILVGVVDAGLGTDTDVDSDTDADTDTESDACTWHTYQVVSGLDAVWGTSAQNVYAVGGGLLSSAVALRFDGVSWTHIGGLGGLTPGFADVFGFGEDDVFAVSYDATVARYDGASWEIDGVVTDAAFGVWGSSPTNLFVVGGGFSYYPLILRSDGDTWVQMGGADGYLMSGVWGSAPNDVFAVGTEAINHLNEYVWSPMDVGSLSLDGVFLEDVWGSSGSDVYTVGYHWAGPVLLHYDGAGWQQIEVASIAGDADLYGVHGAGPDDVWIVGGEQGSGIVLHFDGETWGEIDYPFPFELFDVWVAPTGEVFAVGSLGAIYCSQ